MKKTTDFTSQQVLILQDDIDRYHALWVSDIFKIDGLLFKHYRYGSLIKSIKDNMVLFSSKLFKEKIAVEYCEKHFKLNISGEDYKREVIRSVDSKGNIQIFASVFEEVNQKGVFINQKIASTQTYGKIKYSSDGTFKEQIITKHMRSPAWEQEENTWYGNYTEEEVITNIDNHTLVRKNIKTDYFNPDNSSIYHSYTDSDDIEPSMDKNKIIWHTLTEKEYFDLLVQSINKKPKIVKALRKESVIK